MKSSRPIHLQHYKHVRYVHTYCGLVNFQGYRAWPFTRQRKHVTCRRCLWMIERDEQVVTYKSRLAEWARRKAKKR